MSFPLSDDISEPYQCLIPVVKALMEKAEDLLMFSTYIPDLPDLKNSPVFFNEFQNYSKTKSWKKFMAKKVRKQTYLQLALFEYTTNTPNLGRQSSSQSCDYLE